MAKEPLYPHRPAAETTAPVTVERYHGQIVKVGGSDVQLAVLPEWALEYVQFPAGMMEQYRSALQREHVKLVNVKATVIYFEER